MRPSSRSLTLSEHNRQAIIDHLLAHPGCLQTDAIKALGLHPSVGGTRFYDMADQNEIRREATEILVPNSVNKGTMRRQKSYKCWALVEKTKSAESVRAVLGKNLGNEARAINPINHTPVHKRSTNGEYINGVLRHTEIDRDVIPCPDAMHSGRTERRSSTALEGNW